MIVAFAHTTRALLAGRKTVTRREWKPAHAAKFTAGMLVDAWDHSPRTGKGRKVATIRLTRDPYTEMSDNMPSGHYYREGFQHMIEEGLADVVSGIVNDWRRRPRRLWVVEFELVETVPA